MAEKITVKGDNLTLDILLVRRFGLDGQSLVERALEMNPGLSSLGAILPLGCTVILPDPPRATDEPEPVEVVSLFS